MPYHLYRCDGDQFFLRFDDASTSALPSMACTYKAGWQDGPNAHVLFLGCDVTSEGAVAAPACYDEVGSRDDGS